MNKYDQIYNEKLGELLKGVEFPEMDTINLETFNIFVVNAFQYHNENTLQCSLKEYKQTYWIASNNNFWFMPEMFVALGAVLSLTPDKSLLKTAECIDIPMYIQRREQWNSMLAKWNEIAAPYIKQAQEYVQSVAKRDQRELDVKSKIIGKNGRSIQLPAS